LAAGVLLRKSVPILIVSKVFPALFCTNFRVLGLILRFSIHFELILVQGDRHGSNLSFLQADSCLYLMLAKMLCLSYYFLCFLFNKIGASGVWERGQGSVGREGQNNVCTCEQMNKQ
jgi:hypothetical protein